MPGVYKYSGALNIGSDVTLSGDGVYIFQIDGTFDTAADTNILLDGGAQSCNVFWVPVGAATLAANTTFKGNLLAESGATTVGISTIIDGRILSQGAVTFTGPGPSVITVPSCAVAPPPVIVEPEPEPVVVEPEPDPVVTDPVVTDPEPTPAEEPNVCEDANNETAVKAEVPADAKLISSTDSNFKIWYLANGDLLVYATVTDASNHTGTWNFDFGGHAYTVNGMDDTSYTVVDPPVGTYAASASFASDCEDITLAVETISVPTLTAGELPKTATPWFNLMFMGAIILLLGAAMFMITRTKLRD